MEASWRKHSFDKISTWDGDCVGIVPFKLSPENASNNSDI